VLACPEETRSPMWRLHDTRDPASNAETVADPQSAAQRFISVPGALRAVSGVRSNRLEHGTLRQKVSHCYAPSIALYGH